MRPSRPFLVIILAAVLIHAGAIAWVYHRQGRVDAYAFNSLDCGEYYALARNIVRHGTFSQAEVSPLTPDTWRTPGYPVFLATGMLLVGDSPAGLILLQHIAAIGSVLIFFRIASRYVPPGRAAIASVVFLIEPYHLFYSFWLLSTTIFTLVLLAAWWAWERARESAKVRHYTILGLLCGILVLTWPGAVLIPVAVGAGLLIGRSVGYSTSPHHHIAASPNPRWALVLFLLSCALPIGTWMARNQLVAGHFALSHQSGIVLAYFKATEIELWRQGRTEDRYIETSLNPSSRDSAHTVWDGIDARLCERIAVDGSQCSELRWTNLAQGNKTTFDSFEISRELSTIGRSMLLESPTNTIMCGLVRVVENLTFPLSLAIKPAEGAQVNRMKAGALGVMYSVLVVTAGVGVVRAGKQWPAMYFPVACVVALALTTAPQIDPRFRVSLIPFLAFLALFPARRAQS